MDSVQSTFHFRLDNLYEVVERWSLEDALPVGEQAHQHLLSICLKVLLRNDDTCISKSALQASPLLDYSTHFWFSHMRDCMVFGLTLDQTVVILLEKLFDPCNQHIFLNWLRIHDPCHPEAGHQFEKEIGGFQSRRAYINLLQVPVEVEEDTESEGSDGGLNAVWSRGRRWSRATSPESILPRARSPARLERDFH